jgi:predicted ester cyclase
VLVAGSRVIVRGEVSGTPAGALFGGLIPHSGKSFRIMAIDIQTIESGKIRKTYYMENWFAALTQTSGAAAAARSSASLVPL